MMHHQASCIVQVLGGKSEEVASSSGILIDSYEGLVLTHASLIIPLLEEKTALFDQISEIGYASESDVSGIKIGVILEQYGNKLHDKQHSKNNTSSVPMNNSGDISKTLTTRTHRATLAGIGSSQSRDAKLCSFTGNVSCVWRVNSFHSVLSRIMPPGDGWKFFDKVEENIDSKENKPQELLPDSLDIQAKTNELISCFLLVSLDDWVPYERKLEIVPSLDLHPGDLAQIIATPFGSLSPSVFINSVSNGVMCNLSGDNNVMILTDARCIPGTEGGALYKVTKNQGMEKRLLAGIVVAPMCWKANEWIGLAIACSLSEILNSLEEKVTSEHIVSTNSSDSPGPFPSLSSALEAVVLVKVGNSWGTGVVISAAEGLILTCSHVVKSSRTAMVRVDRASGPRWVRVDVVYATPVGEVFDLAVLKIREHLGNFTAVNVAASIHKGEGCYVIGHALFNSDQAMLPSVTKGNLSNIVRVNNIPVMLQSSCVVHAGASGGPLLSEKGELLGIVTCNAKDTENGASYPHVNMSIPIATVWSCIKEYINSADSAILRKLHIQNKHVKNLWTLKEKGDNVVPSKL